MGLNDIRFKILNGGLGRKGTSKDMTSAIVVDSSFVSTDFATILKFENVDQADVWVKAEMAASRLGLITGAHTNWKKHMYLVFLISDFFRINPDATLYVAVVNEVAGHTFEGKINECQLEAQGQIRQFGLLTPSTVATGEIADTNSAFIDLEEEHKPCITLISNPAAEALNLFVSGGSLLEYVDTNDLKGKYVSAILGCSDDLKTVVDNTLAVMSSIGAVLGLVSLSKVSESIAWVEQCNMMRDDRGIIIPILKKLYPAKLTALSLINWYVNPITANGSKFTNYTESQLVAIQDKGYIFPRKHVGIDGTYMSEAFNLDDRTSDYMKIQNMRTIQKATREIRTSVLPQLNRPIRINAENGQIAPDEASYFESLVEDALEAMKANGEISGYTVEIDLDQPILQTGKLIIKVSIVPYGSADNIEIPIGFTVRTA